MKSLNIVRKVVAHKGHVTYNNIKKVLNVWMFIHSFFPKDTGYISAFKICKFRLSVENFLEGGIL